MIRHEALGQEGQAVFPTHSIGLFDALQPLIGLAEKVEDHGAPGQHPAELEEVPEPARMGIAGVAHALGLRRIAEHPGRERRKAQTA